MPKRSLTTRLYCREHAGGRHITLRQLMMHGYRQSPLAFISQRRSYLPDAGERLNNRKYSKRITRSDDLLYSSIFILKSLLKLNDLMFLFIENFKEGIRRSKYRMKWRLIRQMKLFILHWRGKSLKFLNRMMPMYHRLSKCLGRPIILINTLKILIWQYFMIHICRIYFCLLYS